MNMIAHILEKCKKGIRVLSEKFPKVKNVIFNDDFFIIAIIILVGFGGFGLGRLSKIAEDKTPVYVQKESARFEGVGGASINEANEKARQFVASVKGAKYHLPWCSSASRIKEENKVWFATVEDAESAGYTPAGNCPGL